MVDFVVERRRRSKGFRGRSSECEESSGSGGEHHGDKNTRRSSLVVSFRIQNNKCSNIL